MVSRMMWSLTLLLLVASVVNGFSPKSVIHRHRRRSFILHPTSLDDDAPTSVPAAEKDTSWFTTKQILTEEDVVDLASFRNKCTNPEMMVENAKFRSADVDNTKEALNGLKIGLVFIGIPAFAYDYYVGQDLLHAFKFYGAIGGVIGGFLAYNSLMGKSVYVPGIEESKNRIIVDYAEGLYRKQDVGFVAIAPPEDPKFVPSGGVMGAVDAQLRNSPKSWPGLATVPDFPPHLHIKNMEVHNTQRRQGIARKLLDTLEEYARNETDAEWLTLEVEFENVAAVNLYRNAGFTFEENPTAFTKRRFMVKKLK